MQAASEKEHYEEAAGYRDLLLTLEEIAERQKIAAAAGDDTDVLAWHAEPPQVAVNLFHLRAGRVVDRRDFYWEDLREFDPGGIFPSLLKQIYLDAPTYPRYIHVPGDLEDCELLEEVFSEKSGHRRGNYFASARRRNARFLDLVEKNAKHSFNQRFRTLKPTSQAIAAASQEALGLPESPTRIECFDISHIQGTDTVASMVVWEAGRLKKSDYRKFIIRSGISPRGKMIRQQIFRSSLRTLPFPELPASAGPAAPDAGLLRDDFASMREAVTRRYRRLLDEKKPLPGLILIDGGLGQLHAAAQALDSLEIINQPSPPSQKKKKFFTCWGEKMSLSSSAAIRRFSGSSSRFATRPIASR